jgi:serine/threonine-protein kinase
LAADPFKPGDEPTGPAGDDTLPSRERAEPQLADPHIRELLAWDRYRIGSLLGRGGMGEVYKAWDPRLKRYVAIKLFLPGSGSSQAFVQEAQAQAHVEHEHICKVYEVGEVGGRPFIAMQLIEGRTLAVAAAELAIAQKVRAMALAARAVHAAHRLGIVHRDLKPSNILVERAEDGELKPYVTDFGLARQMEADPTMTGTLLGTPAYMSPEQARGERGLDGRTDVYSLGATLYTLLLGRPPFEGEGALSILYKVVNLEPKPPRALDAGVPPDLEAVVLKCLEKNPTSRYPSAKALAEDLESYLAGGPVQARRLTALGRLRRKARRHAVALSFSTVVLLGLAVFVTGLRLQARREAGVRAEMALKFGEEVNQMAAAMRTARLMPLHDTRAEKAQVRGQLARIEAALAHDPSLAGAAECALGRGYFALRQYEQAEIHLTKGWNAGQHAPECALALGLTLAIRYGDAFAKLNALPAEQQGSARARLPKELRDSAVRFLRGAARLSPGQLAYAEGMIAYTEGRYDDALKSAEEAQRHDVWLYEASRLEGDARMARREFGRGVPGDLKRAGDAYQRAVEIGRSDAELYVAQCRWRQHLADSELEDDLAAEDRVPDPPEKLLDEALASCGRAEKADPENPRVFTTLANTWDVHASIDARRGRDPREALGKQMAAAEAAVRLDARDSRVQFNLGSANLSSAEYGFARGQDERARVARAIEAWERAVQLGPYDPTAWMAHVNIVFAADDQARWELERGLDPRPAIALGLRAAARADEVSAGSALPMVASLHHLEGLLAVREGRDPMPSFTRAIEADRDAIARRLVGWVPWSAPMHLAQTRAAAARHLLSLGRDPAAQLDDGLRVIDEVVAKHTGSAGPFALKGQLCLLRVKHERARDRDPGAALACAEAALARAQAIQADNQAAQDGRAELELLRGQLLAAHDRDPTGALDRAHASCDRARHDHPSKLEPLRVCAEVALERAAWLVHRGQSPVRVLAEVDALTRQATALNPLDASSFEQRAIMHRRTAEWQARHGAPADAEIAAGIADAAQALRLKPDLAAAEAERSALVAFRTPASK